MPDSFLDVIDAFLCNESAMGIIQVCKLEGNTKVFRATKGTQACSGKFFRKRCYLSVLP